MNDIADALTQQVGFTLRGRNPDVLTCIANLSNDEVFTPPDFAKRMLDTAENVRREIPRISSRELVELLFEQPYCRIGNLVDAGLAHRQTASTHLTKLCDIGILREEKAGREKLFINPALLSALKAAD